VTVAVATSPAMTERFDLDALRKLLDLNVTEFARWSGYSRELIYAWRRQGGAGVVVADALACRAGYHPGIVWPAWWVVSDPAA
jgi:hypothetical protein